MPFSIKSAQKIFQKHISQLLSELPGVETDIVNILIWGKTKEEHDKQLNAVLNCREVINLLLNKNKCLFTVPQFASHLHRSPPECKRCKPDEDKVKAIHEMPASLDKKGVERSIGTVNYLAKFIPNKSTMTKPIRDVLKAEIMFH